MSETTPLISSSHANLSRHETAAWLLDSTIRDAPVYNHSDVPRTRKMRKNYLFFENTSIVRETAVILLIFLSLFELPSYCSAARKCVSPDGSELFLSGVPYLSSLQQLFINAFLLSILLFFYFFDIKFLPQVRLHAHNRFLGFLLAALVIDFLWVAAWAGYPPFRPAPFIRAFLPFFYWHSLTEVSYGISAVLNPFVDIFLVLTLFTLFFGWMVTIVFHQSVPADEYFGNLAIGLYSAFTSMTTADWPVQEMGILDENRIFALLFLAFILIGVFLLFNVLLAVVYNAYTEYIEGVVEKKLDARMKNINLAYDVLTEDCEDCLSLDDIHMVFDELRKNKKLQDISEEQVEHIFTALDDNADSRISRDEFLDVVDLLQVKFVEDLESESFVEKYFPGIYETRTWQNIAHYVRSSSFTYMIDVVMVLNIILVIIETTMDLRETDRPQYVRAFAIIECAFSFFYVIEIFLRIASQGFDRYWKDYSNRFDCVLTPLLLMGAIVVLWPGSEVNPELIRYLVILRCLRLFQLLSDIPRFKRLGQVLAMLIPASIPLFSVLFLSLSVFAAIGLETFGGLIYENNPALNPATNPAVDGYVSSDYWVLNFNDMAASWYTLFSVVIVNYMTEPAEAIAAVHKWGNLTKWFFIVNFIINSLIVSNCVVAFVVDLFISVDADSDDSQLRALQKRYGGKRVSVMYKSMNTDRIYSSMFRDQIVNSLGPLSSSENLIQT